MERNARPKVSHPSKQSFAPPKRYHLSLRVHRPFERFGNCSTAVVMVDARASRHFAFSEIASLASKLEAALKAGPLGGGGKRIVSALTVKLVAAQMSVR